MRGLHAPYNFQTMSQPWNNTTFSEIMRTQSFRKAFEYRLECLGTPIPEEYLTDEEKTALKDPVALVETVADIVPEPPVLEAPTEPVEPAQSFTVEEVKGMLTKNNIKFHHKLSGEKIMELAVANNLI